MIKLIDGEELKVPRHVAFILDGNGRWAKKKNMPRKYGHVQGAKAVEQMCEDAYHLGIEYLTVYAFSTENWKRPQDEVDALMKLLKSYLSDCIKTAKKNHLKVRVIGDKTGLDSAIVEKIDELIEASKDNDGLNFTIALNYGSRDEIRRSMVAIAKDVEEGRLSSGDITEELINSRLDTYELPDPDLLIRTSGEQRLSNYMLWQLAYSEFYFTEVLLPDFKREDMVKAIRYYNGRERRFGGV